MPIKVSITDLKTHIIYRGSILDLTIQTGRDLVIRLDHSNEDVCIRQVRGWLASTDYDNLFYLMDHHGNRFKVRITSPMVIQLKQ